jgi:hypothetical protein
MNPIVRNNFLLGDPLEIGRNDRANPTEECSNAAACFAAPPCPRQ